MNRIQSISSHIYHTAPEKLGIEPRLPSESKISHYSREIFILIAETFSTIALLVAAVTPLNTALTPLKLLVGIALMGRGINQESAGLTVGIIAFLGIRLLLSPKNVLAGGIGMYICGIITSTLRDSSTSYTIGKEGQVLTENQLAEELSAIVASKRKIKQLTICGNPQTYALSDSMLKDLQAIKPQTIELRGFSLNQENLSQLNQALNSDPEGQQISFYYFKNSNIETGSYTLEIETFENSTDQKYQLNLTAHSSAAIQSYCEQAKNSLDTRFPDTKYQIFLSIDAQENPLEISQDAANAILHLEPAKITLNSTREEGSRETWKHLFNSLNRCFESRNAEGPAYYGLQRQRVISGRDSNVQCNFKRQLINSSKSYAIGYHEQMTLSNEDILDCMNRIPSNSLDRLRITAGGESDLALEQNVVEEVKRILPKALYLSRCTLSNEQLLDINKALNLDPNSPTIVTYRRSHNDLHLSKTENTYSMTNEFESIQLVELMAQRSIPLAELTITLELHHRTLSVLEELPKLSKVIKFNNSRCEEQTLKWLQERYTLTSVAGFEHVWNLKPNVNS